MEADRRILQRSKWLVVICFISILFIGVKIMMHPVEEAEDETREPEVHLMSDLISPRLQKDELGAVEIMREWDKGAEEYEEWEKKYKRIPRFIKPKHEMVTRDQVERVYEVWTTCANKFKRFRRDHLRRTPQFFKVVALNAYLPVLVHLCRKRALVEQNMREEELNWVFNRLNEAGLFCLNRKVEKGSVTKKEAPHVERTRKAICFALGKELHEEKEGYVEYYPEKLNTERIPRCNVELFLEMKDQVRWVHIDYRSISFDEEDILSAAQALPPCPP